MSKEFNYDDWLLHGPARRVQWVTDAARTVHYLYTPKGNLQCITLGTNCGTESSRPADVLAYFRRALSV